MAMDLPVTERSNVISRSIDEASAVAIVSTLRQTDTELWQTTWHDARTGQEWASVLGQPCVDTMVSLVRATTAVLQRCEQRNHVAGIVFSGSGTSGRMAHYCATALNAVCHTFERPPVFHYLIAGGDEALIAAKEAREDDPHTGVADLVRVTQGCDEVVFVGITCGMSAPYVAGQLLHCMDHEERFVTALLGCNPLALARNAPIEGWEHTFTSVAARLQAAVASGSQRHAILNPVVGPEAITGSTRMKGGSVTKVLLEVVFSLSLRNAYGVADEPMSHGEDDATGALQGTLKASIAAYAEACAQGATQSLANGGHIYYVSDNIAYGMLGVIDASECPPTFGAKQGDVWAYVAQGWASVVRAGVSDDLGSSADVTPYALALDDLQPDAKDTVILLMDSHEPEAPSPALVACMARVQEVGAWMGCICVGVGASDSVDVNSASVGASLPGLHAHPWTSLLVPARAIVRVPISQPGVMDGGHHGCSQLAVKLCLNAVTTGAHIGIGKVFSNRMIDVRVSNNKLYYRASRIVSQLTKCTPEVAESCVQRSIHLLDDVSMVRDLPISEHIRVASTRNRVVPAAALLAAGICTTVAAAQAKVNGLALSSSVSLSSSGTGPVENMRTLLQSCGMNAE